MIELVPFMLMLVWAAPDQPGRVEVERIATLFASEAECEKAGASTVGAAPDTIITYTCMPIPGRDEFDRLFSELDAQSRAADLRGQE